MTKAQRRAVMRDIANSNRRTDYRNGNSNGNKNFNTSGNKIRDRLIRLQNQANVSYSGPKRVNTSYAPVSQGSMIKRLPSSLDNMVFRHSELVLSITGTVDFDVGSLKIQPGLSTSFPWLSNLASLWDMYNVINITFRYVPTCATSTSGSLMLAFDYDAYDAQPGSKNDFMMYQDSCIAPSWSDCVLSLRRSSLAKRKNLYIRQGSYEGDLKTYDLGTLYYGTQGQPNTNFIGDIYCDYHIVMSMPQAIPAPIETYYSIGTVEITGATAAIPWGTNVPSANEYASNPPGFATYSDGVNKYVFERPGSYFVQYLYQGTGLGTPAMALGDTTTFPDDTIQAVTNFVQSGSTRAVIANVVKVSELQWVTATFSAITTMTEVYILVFPAEPLLNY